MGTLPAALFVAMLQAQVAAPPDGGVAASPDAAAAPAPAPAEAADGGVAAVKPPALVHFVPAVYPPDA